MPYLHFNLPGRYPASVKRQAAEAACRAYAEIMETQLWRPNVGMAELGTDSLFRLGDAGLEEIIMVLVECRRGRSSHQRLALARRLVEICTDAFGLTTKRIFVEFTAHVGDEMFREGDWVQDWSADEATQLRV
jgi:hypothetical protein